jgi:ribonuclease I
MYVPAGVEVERPMKGGWIRSSTVYHSRKMAAVFVAAAGCLGMALSAATTDTPGDFDSFVLEQSWQPTFCAGEHYPGCVQPTEYMKTHLTLHGLWPQYDKSRGGATYPQNCATTPFDPVASPSFSLSPPPPHAH